MRWVLRAAVALVVVVAVLAAWSFVSWTLTDGRLPPDAPRAVVASDGVPSRPVLRRAGVDQVLVPAGQVPAGGRLRTATAPPDRGAEVRLLARVTARDVRGGGTFRLADPAARRAVADSARRLLERGFDGIHVAVRPWLDEDPAMLDLLDRLRDVTARRGARLSVAVPAIEPARGLAFVSQLVAGRRGTWHTARSLRRVAQRVDQVVVRVPLGWAPVGWLTGSLARRTIGKAAGALGASRVDLLAAVPAGQPATGLRAVAQAARAAGTRPPVGIVAPAAWLADGRLTR